jgi:hypothetical protein
MTTERHDTPGKLSETSASIIAILLIPFFITTVWIALQLLNLDAFTNWCILPLGLTVIYWAVYFTKRHRPWAPSLLFLLALMLGVIVAPLLNVLCLLLGTRSPAS